MSKNNDKIYKDQSSFRMCGPCEAPFKSWINGKDTSWRKKRLIFCGVFFTVIGLYWLGRIYGIINYDQNIARSFFPVILIVFGVWLLIISIIKRRESNEE